ncbi:hypothetical protein [Alienimonas californiensis]|uniref:Uncharacterized protein n=1 Tax=Alienimonas californiensis TaxID=2527989 RepID=A0A517PAT7_9PLAN|nr:hypothetical protein [Alienimonas californiensis]QDT16492.1 hypothetical protein CA12_25960 [Alienimonas californiensis]
MTSATRPAASPGPFSRRRRPLRRALWAATLAGCCGTVGCQGTGGPLALLKRGDATSGSAVAEDPFNAAETALASASGPGGQGKEGRASLGLGGGVVRTASLDGARTAARPASGSTASGVTRVDPNKPPQSAAGRWKAGEGSDAGAAKVTLAGGAFAASDAPAEARVTPVAAQQTARAAMPAAAPATPAAKAPAATDTKEDIDWGAEMAAFADKAAAETSTPVDSPATPNPTPAKESTGVTKPAATVTENLGDPLDRESLPHAPLWNASAESEPAEPAAAPVKPAVPAPSAAAPAAEDDGWRSRTAAEPAPAASAKTEPAAAIDPFAGL